MNPASVPPVETAMKIRAGKSLGTRISLIFVGFATLAILVLELLAASADIDGSLWVAQFNKAKIAHVLSSSMAEHVKEGDSEKLRFLLENYPPLALHQRMAQAEVFDSNGRRLVNFTPSAFESREKLSETLPWKSAFVSNASNNVKQVTRIEGTDYWVASPIVVPGTNDRVGTFLLRYDVGIIRDISLSRVEKQLAIAVVLLTGLIISLLFLTRNMLSKPLSQITQSASSVAAGNYEQEVPHSGRTDEIGAISRAIDILRTTGLEADTLRQQTDAARAVADEQRQAAELAERERREASDKQVKVELAKAEADAVQSAELKHRIEQLMLAVDAASTGDFTYKIDIGNKDDDLSKVASALTKLFDELNTSIGEIGDTAIRLNGAAKELSGLSSTVSGSARRNAEQASMASETSSRVSTSVDTVEKSTNEMNMSIKNILSNTKEVATVVASAVELGQSTGQNVRQLAESSQGIGDVIKVITSIAEQTNLLALNATIEAARAGDAGKGFAVVANEVKDLAKETARATEEIEQRIDRIQTDTETAVTSIADINDIVQRISEIQATVAAAVDEQADTTIEINAKICEVSKGNMSISELITEVSEYSNEGLSSADNISRAANQMDELAVNLDLLMDRLKKGAGTR